MKIEEINIQINIQQPENILLMSRLLNYYFVFNTEFVKHSIYGLAFLIWLARVE